MGKRAYIDRSEPRPCSAQCHCWDLDSEPEEDNFSFTISKTTSTIEITFHSALIRSCVSHLLEQDLPDSTISKLDGFILLKNFGRLKSCIRALRQVRKGTITEACRRILLETRTSPEDDSKLEAEMCLLVEGVLQDSEVFQSFGYENLYERGYLSYDRWKAFQRERTSRAIDLLDSAFHVIDQQNDILPISHGSQNDHTEPSLSPYPVSIDNLEEIDKASLFDGHKTFLGHDMEDTSMLQFLDFLSMETSTTISSMEGQPSSSQRKMNSCSDAKLYRFYRKYRSQHANILTSARASIARESSHDGETPAVWHGVKGLIESTQKCGVGV